MSDSQEPPAKRARLEADAPFTGVSSFDAPGSPVDDMDYDFYDTTPVKPAALSAPHDGPSASLTATAPAPSSFSMPGLGSLGDTTVTQPTAQIDADTVMNTAVHDEGELKDEEAFNHDASAVEPPLANQLQALNEAPQHGKPSRPELHAASLTPAQDASATLTTTSPVFDVAETVTDPAPAVDAQIKQESETAAAPAEEAQEPTADESKAEFLRVGEANKDNKDAEWQLDSDASDSSSDSSSSDDSSDDEAEDGELMDPEEMVRLLMAESADDAGATGKAKVKTLNELDEQYEKPDIKVENETQITELGKVEAVVDNLVLVKANTSGDYQVLESGSALCLRDFTIIGKISEQIGRVEEPRYSVGFNDPAEIATIGITKDTTIYYVDAHSTFVFTEPLRNQRHTDASNLHDEETNEVEFSDDEAEAEFKRQQKQAKKARQEAKNEPEPEQKPIPTGPRGHVDKPVSYFSPANEYQGGGLKYSDDEDEDLGMYKPLARPSHFEEIVGQGAPLEDRSHVRRGMMRGRGGWGDRGRGFRGRGNFGGRGDFGGGRGDFSGGRGGRGDARGGRGDRGGGDRGGRGNKQADRGRPQNQQQDSRQMSVPRPDNRSATSASPARQQERQQSSQPQHSPPAKSKNKNRKQRQREKREREAQEKQQNQQQQSQQQSQQQPQKQQQQLQKQQQQPQKQQQQQQHASPAPSGPSNANSYATNSSTGWPTQYPQPAAPAATYPPAPAPAAAASYANPAQYAQQPATQAQPNQQANWAAWAQWFQVVGAMSQQGAQAQQQPQPQQYVQPQAQAPPPPPPQPQAQAQYGYPQQWQYPQNAAPAPNTNAQQGNAQAGAQSLQDILRALGAGGGGQA
ncbi:NAF1-domain-containing protein [Macroventuria anomochaeta]|uniref:NAF1-domain-containing protein n=1 Tax=Macroventuria anomochaeta TaxID=301207 RepID=A0ACB6SCF3_9PLEO|nr:NAF1-domain-containing protein [Macroventuria anomochaeta]KAF2631729.1 NAF1-domain-containing protein [Macroventuria anomochaeta]